MTLLFRSLRVSCQHVHNIDFMNVQKNLLECLELRVVCYEKEHFPIIVACCQYSTRNLSFYNLQRFSVRFFLSFILSVITLVCVLSSGYQTFQKLQL